MARSVEASALAESGNLPPEPPQDEISHASAVARLVRGYALGSRREQSDATTGGHDDGE